MLKQRIVTAVLLLAALLAALWAGRAVFVLAIGLLFVAAVFEWQRLAGRSNAVSGAVAVVLVALLLALEFAGRSPAAGLLVWICAAATATWLLLALLLVQVQRHGLQMGGAAAAVLGVALLAAAWFALLALHARGLLFLVSVLAIVWIADICAYFAGRAFGRRKLASRISPGKTWAGVAGALAGVLAVAAVAWLALPAADLFSSLLFRRSPLLAPLLLAALVVFSIAGDLFESLLKRQAGMKDSSGLLPGHGGVLDRIDALLPVLPLALLLTAWAQ